MSDFNYIQNLLELKDVIMTNIINYYDFVQINVEMPVKSHNCPCCNTITSKVHDYRMQLIKDIPIYKKKTLINYRKRRYVCPNCMKRFYEDNNLVAKYQHKTSRLNMWIVQELRKVQSLKDIANYLHVSSPTIARILDVISPTAPSTLPSVIALDEFKGNASTGKYQCIFTDPSTRKTLDILPVRNEARLREYFRKYTFQERSKVQYAVIDMWRPYAQLITQLFPKAKIVIDRFHYVRQVIWALENTRKKVQKNLSKNDRIYFKNSKKLLLMNSHKLKDEDYWRLRKMFRLEPELEKAYDLKENFYWVLEANNSKEAKERLDIWYKDVKYYNIKEFKNAYKTLKNWERYILNSFDVPYTNGYTEGTNNKIKVIKRNAYGLRVFNRMRTRILLNT